MVLTYRYRLKDGNQRAQLKKLAGQVNVTWNFANEVIRETGEGHENTPARTIFTR